MDSSQAASAKDAQHSNLAGVRLAVIKPTGEPYCRPTKRTRFTSKAMPVSDPYLCGDLPAPVPQSE